MKTTISIYPREAKLLRRYLRACITGATAAATNDPEHIALVQTLACRILASLPKQNQKDAPQ